MEIRNFLNINQCKNDKKANSFQFRFGLNGANLSPLQKDTISFCGMKKSDFYKLLTNENK